MHISTPRRFMGGYGIVGGNLPIAAGIGWPATTGNDEVTLCVFGDGASNQGTFGRRSTWPRCGGCRWCSW